MRHRPVIAAGPRPGNLLDAMILISAIALGLAAARCWYDQPGYVGTWPLDVQSICDLVAWVLLPLSLALIVIRLRKPHPRWRRLVRQPGFQASLLVGLATVARLLGNHWGYRPTLFEFFLIGIGFRQANDVVPIMSIGWLLTALVGARRPEPGTIDRLGLALGWAWIGLWVVTLVLGETSIVRRLWGPWPTNTGATVISS
jgi:hypothetical protein